ncbi:MAG: SUMF1/EgtB/PvdO family nonheme iron enzyme [Chloroflexota bacterium]
MNNPQQTDGNLYRNHVGGDLVGRDKIAVGNVAGSYNAIGAGASVIVNQIQQAWSAVEELEKGIALAERRLVEAIQRKLHTIADLASEKEASRGNPYKALLDYELQDAPFFYGRSAAINTLLEKIGRNRLTILHAESGSGKTSLLQAGLASRLLADGAFPLYLRPYRQPPRQAIKKAFLADYAMQPDLERFRDGQMSLKGFLEKVTHYLGEHRLYIFLDQFEEFFIELSPNEQSAFAEELQACVESDLPVWWVLSLRKEYFSDLRLFGALRPFSNSYFLPTFKLEEAREVLTEPAAQRGVDYEAGLIDEILADLSQGADGIAPVQMQLVCYTLFEELHEAGNADQIRKTLYQKPRGRGVGGAEGILASHLTRVLHREMSGRERQVASQALEALTTSQKMRVKKSETDLGSELSEVEPAALERVLEILHNSHLIRREMDDNDDSVYELAHDYLLAEIELDPETQGRKLAQEIVNQELMIWRENGRSRIAADKLLLIEPHLSVLNLTPEVESLVGLSQEAVQAEAEAKEQMRKRQLYLAWGITAVLAIIIGILVTPTLRSWYYQRQARAETWLVPIGGAEQTFQMEAHEVSNQQYGYCVMTNVCSLPQDPTHGYLNEEQQNLPIVGITAVQARTYCQWLGRQLPTAVEWQLAYNQQPTSPETANLIHDFNAPMPELNPITNDQTEAETGLQFFHLVGNAMEMTRTIAPVERSGSVVLWDGTVSSDCSESSKTACNQRALQAVGGGILSSSKYFVSDDAFPISPFGSSDDLGFRCVATN